MTATPLFQTRAALLAQIRMTSAPSGTDAQSILDGCIGEARTTFYRRLGITRTSQIVAFTAETPPTTEEGILRDIAAQTEVKIVRSLAIRQLPMMFMDGSGKRDMVWNDEGATRQAAIYELAREGDRLSREIEANMLLLAGTTSVGDESRIRMTAIDPYEDDSDNRPRPGSTIWGT